MARLGRVWGQLALSELAEDFDEQLPRGTLTGLTLDERYQVGGVLGEGGAGVVYAGTHIALGKSVAIKFIRPLSFNNELAHKRFLREAQSASRVTHPNIVHVSDFNVLSDGSAYLVMERLKGQTLREAMREAGQLDVVRALGIASQIAAALAAAHERGIVHRDLKPENIFLSFLESGVFRNLQEVQLERVKVLDFGIAKIVGSAQQEWTAQGRVLGSLRYMSPEQCLGEPVDARADVYALGVLLYEMLTGMHPFESKRLPDLIEKQLRSEAPTLRERASDIPPDLEALVHRCLRKAPHERFDSMKQLAERMQSLAAAITTQRIRGGGNRLAEQEASHELMSPLSTPNALPPLEASTSGVRCASRRRRFSWSGTLPLALGVMACCYLGFALHSWLSRV